jgi:tetratricopeptide (TPR) repeat protein
MNKKVENLLYLRASDCLGSLKLAIEAFEDFLEAGSAAAGPVYYKARNYLRDGQKFYDEAFKEAKRLLGPLPPYASSEFEKWRAEFLSTHSILTSSEEREEIKNELLSNGFLAQWISADDIDRLLSKHYETQKTGKRKLANIKVRIVLERMNELITQAQNLKKKAMEKIQPGGGTPPREG